MLLKNVLISVDNQLVKKDILIENGNIAKIADYINDTYNSVDLNGFLAIPGAIDPHVHLRDPGFEYKETIITATQGAAKGGITSVLAMPNTNPVPDSKFNAEKIFDKINRQAVVSAYLYGSVTQGQKGAKVSDIRGMRPYVIALSDDGVGVNDLKVLEEAMYVAKEEGLVISSHAEASGYGYSPEAEYIAVDREIELAKKIGVKYHFCHMSVKQSFDFIRAAKKDGVDVTCEVTPHHLFLNSTMSDGSANYKMNPPLRSVEDMHETVKALLDGTADMVATDHAPHSKEEKKRAYKDAPNGIIGLETMLPLVYTGLVMNGKLSYSKFIEVTSTNAAKRFGLPTHEIKVGSRADIAVLNIGDKHLYTENEIVSLSKNSPFIGAELYGMNVMTIIGDKLVYTDKKIKDRINNM